ncbi:MAG TPA: hypothetical protein VIV61_10455 [Candidatus Ozemobacteraceae bacterium]
MRDVRFGREGMVLVVVIVCIIFVTIFFASMVGRVRHESGLTARASINERLYQVATAIGRLTVRKLQRDFETYDKKSEQNIIDMVFNNGGKIKDVSYDSIISNLDVVKKIREEFKSRWGDLDIKVTYSVEVPDKNDFPPYMSGLDNSPFERRGYISADVKVTHRSHSKHCKISKQFLLTRLFAAPFHRFTLFSTCGAALDPDKVNRLEKFYDDGTVLDPKPPLQLFNQRIKGNKMTVGDVNYLNRDVNPVVTSADSFVQNGWVYLGSGYSGDKTLRLNVMAGSMGGMPDDASDSKHYKKYGEFFHLYYTAKSLGWRGSSAWGAWLNSRFPGITDGDPPALKISYVDYGYFRYIGQNNPIEINQLEAPPGTGQTVFGHIDTSKFKASALHLFGTPTMCTPTLLFGRIERQYLRTMAFLVEKNIWPIRWMTAQSDLTDLWQNDIEPWLANFSGDRIDQARDALSQLLVSTPSQGGTPSPHAIPFELYRDGSARDPSVGPPLRPHLTNSPYMTVLQNLAKPSSVEPWNTAVPSNKYLPNGPGDLMKSDYEFKDDENLHYSGKINAIRVDPKYFDALKQRTSYYINEKPTNGDALPLFDDPKFPFFDDEFIDKEDDGPKTEKACYLNQIIGFESSVEINKPLRMLKGGIIWTKKDIIISAPIINPYLEKATSNDNFGWLTLVAGGRIIIRNDKFPAKSGGGFPELHAFLVCCNGNTGRVSIDSPVHIIGGVAVDDMSDLIEKGSIIEWGFMRSELSVGVKSSGKNDLTSEDFHGLAMGPMDGEVVFEQ